MKYCESIYLTKRRQTRTVFVGNVGVGGDNPIRIQSMTTSDTRNAAATAEQIMRLADAGCEIARVTVQGIKEADSCQEIKNALVQKGYTIPLVADIHFFPPAAMRVAEFADKVRVNPGNFVDKRASFKVIEYDDVTYAQEIERIEEKFSPLVLKCKQLKRAMRIGTNHGSLSDRIMNRYGDTPMGMVESALEFARVCRKYDYHDFMFSMKASNPQVMVLAYRLLVAEMYTLGWDYPLHLGVTEAGEGEDGRVKSAMGIGALLLDGIGDTIRVSLTEDPWYEIDPCKRLVDIAAAREGRGIAPFIENHRQIDALKKRDVLLPKTVAWHRDGTVILPVTQQHVLQDDFYTQLGCKEVADKPVLQRASADALYLKECDPHQEKMKSLQDIGIGVVEPISLKDALASKYKEKFKPLATLHSKETNIVRITDESMEQWSILKEINPPYILFAPSVERMHNARRFFDWLQDEGLDIPVVLNFSYDCSFDDLVMMASAECGSLLCDGLGDGLLIEGDYNLDDLRRLSFNILQGARRRTVKTEFISCPSCGRTLFDLQDVTRRIKERTQHLPGVKIAIMGCIVNGPGEMADADFGYVGSKPGKIDLYVGKEKVERDIEFADADDRLVALIKAHGRWQEREEAEKPEAETLLKMI